MLENLQAAEGGRSPLPKDQESPSLSVLWMEGILEDNFPHLPASQVSHYHPSPIRREKQPPGSVKHLQVGRSVRHVCFRLFQLPHQLLSGGSRQLTNPFLHSCLLLAKVGKHVGEGSQSGGGKGGREERFRSPHLKTVQIWRFGGSQEVL